MPEVLNSFESLEFVTLLRLLCPVSLLRATAFSCGCIYWREIYMYQRRID